MSTLLDDGSRAVSYASETSSARVVDVRYPRGSDFDTHEHHEAYLCLTVHGGYQEWADAGRRAVPTGEVRVYSAGSTHAVRTGPDGCRILHVTDPTRRDWAEADPLTTGLLWQLAAAVSVPEAADGDADRLHLECLVNELVPGDPTNVDYRRAVGDGGWLEVVRAELRDRYSEAISLTALARAIGRHPAHLARAFRVRWAMTPGEYLRRIRVAAAVRALSETDDPVAFVALETGFADQSHLGRWMRRYTGLTPGAFRRRSARGG